MMVMMTIGDLAMNQRMPWKVSQKMYEYAVQRSRLLNLALTLSDGGCSSASSICAVNRHTIGYNFHKFYNFISHNLFFIEKWSCKRVKLTGIWRTDWRTIAFHFAHYWWQTKIQIGYRLIFNGYKCISRWPRQVRRHLLLLMRPTVVQTQNNGKLISAFLLLWMNFLMTIVHVFPSLHFIFQ